VLFFSIVREPQRTSKPAGAAKTASSAASSSSSSSTTTTAAAAAATLSGAKPAERGPYAPVADAEDGTDPQGSDEVSDQAGPSAVVPQQSEAAPEERKVEEYTVMQAIKLTLSEPTVLLLFAAASLRFLGGYSIGSFLPIYYNRQFSEFRDQYSVLNAFVVSVGGALSSYLGGAISDAWCKRTPRARALIPAIGSSLALLPFALTMFSSNFYVSIAGLFLEYLLAECWFGPALAILQNALPSAVRGTAIAVYLFLGTLIGNAAPAIIGLLDPGSVAIRYYLFFAVVISYAGCAVLFFILSALIGAKTDASNRPLLSK
jgi:hypothetical protein